MDIIKAFKLDNTEVQINILGTDTDPLFKATEIGSLLGLTNIHVTLKDFDEQEKVLSTTYTLGGNQQTTLLTELGLYRLLGLSRKPIARYFQRWVCQVIKEIRINGKYELQASIELERTLAQKNIELERHNTLINAFKNKRILYFTKLQQHDPDKYIIKLGFSNNIEARQRALVTSFGSSTFLHVYECNQNCEFELMLKRHPDFVQYRYKEVIVKNKSSETYLLTLEQFNKLMDIVKRNIQNYQGFNPEQYLEDKRLDIQKEIICLLKDNPQSKELQEALLQSMKRQSTLDDEVNYSQSQSNIDLNLEEEVPAIGEGTNIPRINTRNRKVQKYSVGEDGITFKLVYTYEGIMDTVRKNRECSKFGIKHAATNNTVYNGFRWYLIEPDAEAIEYDIPPTCVANTSIPKHIAMLDINKTIIENVFVSLQDAAIAMNIKRKSTIYEAIKDNKLVKNLKYFRYFDTCEDELKNAFLARSNLPTLVLPKGTKIQQIHPSTKQVLKVYNSIADVLKHIVISREHLKRACETGESANNFIWRYAYQ